MFTATRILAWRTEVRPCDVHNSTHQCDAVCIQTGLIGSQKPQPSSSAHQLTRHLWILISMAGKAITAEESQVPVVQLYFVQTSQLQLAGKVSCRRLKAWPPQCRRVWRLLQLQCLRGTPHATH
ncbi:hypothetical protein JG687_00014467 [Phytophthora cactorum]|uniref:Uncharacterized protein n=1 Tax=Phytophthora cactorum TaxID=29920 RepID=A0A8T1TYP2_9STRA|nr:hypothetical protein JG687_00014467 [Phytophthora cactorum]